MPDDPLAVAALGGPVQVVIGSNQGEVVGGVPSGDLSCALLHREKTDCYAHAHSPLANKN